MSREEDRVDTLYGTPQKPGSPGDILEHHGVKGMKWGVRKQEGLVGRVGPKALTPGTPEFQQVLERVTRTDHPQMLGATSRIGNSSPNQASGKVSRQSTEHKGLTKEQKMLITFGATTAAAAGYIAYKHYVGKSVPGLNPVDAAEALRRQEQLLEGMNLPKSWDVSGLKHGPISNKPLGKLAEGIPALQLLEQENLVINTSRGYADILPKNGFSNPFAAEQHASVTKVLEEMREKYPTVRNMNVEVVPMSKVPGMIDSGANMCVLGMGPGEARVMYNDLMDKPDSLTILANKKFLPGLAYKDYVAYHEMGHLLAAAGGALPPAGNLFLEGTSPAAITKWQKAEPLLHKRMFSKHGFSFKELSKLSQYAATQPAEAMAELVGHYLQPDMRQRLTPDQVSRAQAMINEMGGLAG